MQPETRTLMEAAVHPRMRATRTRPETNPADRAAPAPIMRALPAIITRESPYTDDPQRSTGRKRMQRKFPLHSFLWEYLMGHGQKFGEYTINKKEETGELRCQDEF